MITINSEGFRILKRQNALFHGKVNYNKAQTQHAALCKAIGSINFPAGGLPDEVFVANTALSLPRLPTTFLLANYKYAQRKAEPYYLAPFLRKLGKVVPWPYDSIWEGQGETKWFYGGTILVVGYGFRCTKQSVTDLSEIITKIYNAHGVKPPLVVGVKLLDPRFYHMDIATLSLGDKCLIQAGAIGEKDVNILVNLGIECHVHSFCDVFALNSVLKGNVLYTHVLKDRARKILNRYGFTIVELDVSEFEKSGGGVRCMVLTIC